MQKKEKIIYVVYAKIPNDMAHSIQITHTVEALREVVDKISLVTPYFRGLNDKGVYKTQDINVVLPAIDILRSTKFGFRLRMVSFLVSLYFYLIFEYVKSLVTRKKTILYVRGDMILGLVPFTLLFDTYFETHFIRNAKKAYKWVSRFLAGIIVITDSLKEKLVSEFGVNEKRICVARDAVDLSKFGLSQRANESLPSGLEEDKKIVLYSGSLTADKGVHVLAEAAKQIKAPVQVVFLGGVGNQVAEFKELYSCYENIAILGLVDHSEVPRYLQAADLLILPDLSTSTFNNLYTSPMKLFEYMASGTPIIASDVPSLKEVLNTENAFFFESGNAANLASVIHKSLSDVEGSKERAQMAQNEVSKYTWSERASVIINLIRDRKC